MSNPSPDEIVQSETPDVMATVPVKVETPVRIQRLPGPIGFSVGIPGVNSTQAQQLLRADPRRGFTQIISTDQPFFYGNSQQEAQAGSSAVWPDLVPLTINHADEVWVMCAASGSTTTVAAVGELWTV